MEGRNTWRLRGNPLAQTTLQSLIKGLEIMRPAGDYAASAILEK
jgi:hypothetical protein